MMTLLAVPIVAFSLAVGGTPAMAEALTPAAVQQFLTNPSALLAQFPNGGQPLSAQIRDLLASNPATLDAILALLKNASPDQASAIGVGLGQAAELLVHSDPDLATKIQTAVVQSANGPAMVAFSATVGGDIQLAAAGPGTGGGGGGESPTGQNASGGFGGGGTPEFLSSFANNTSDSFPGPSFTAGSPGSLSASASIP
jgi:hypothetical protein